MNIPANNFVKEYKSIKKDIDTSISRVLNSGWFILGEEGKNFEREFAKFIGAKYCIGVASGTDALTFAIKALGLKADDEVLVPVNVYPSIFGIFHAGVRIRLVDVDPNTLNISPEALSRAITKKTKAIVAVHLYGTPVDFDPIKKIAKKNKLHIIEDCAQSTGALYKGRNVGSLGDISCFSFYPTKNLGAYGDGGALVTNSKKIYERILLLRMYGEKGRYNSVLTGYNSRLDEIQAAILRAKLPHALEWNDKRRKLAKLYRKHLAGLQVDFVEGGPNFDSCYHLFVILVKKRDMLLEFLKKEGIGAGIHYPHLIHQVKSFKFLGYKKGDFPNAERLNGNVLSLPINPQMTGKEVIHVCGTISKFFDSL